VSVVVIFIMFFAVMVMVKNIDNEREQQPIIAPDSSETEDTIKAQE
jgi:hypothetical protein